MECYSELKGKKKKERDFGINNLNKSVNFNIVLNAKAE
jgi:hypothetical protein